MSTPLRHVSIPSLLVAALLLAASCGGRSGSGRHFGEPFTDAPAVTPAQLLETPDAYARQSVRVSGIITRQCPASGCWFFIRDDGGHSIKVDLGDYLPQLPQNIGSRAEVEGEWIKQGEGQVFIGTRVTFSRQEAAP